MDINYLLLFSDLYIFKIYSRAFLSDYKNTVLFLYELFAYKTSYLFFFFYLSTTVWGKSKPFPKTFTFWSSNVRDGRISLFKGPRHNLKSIFFNFYFVWLIVHLKWLTKFWMLKGKCQKSLLCKQSSNLVFVYN